MIVELIFGVSYNALEEKVVIAPKLVPELKNSFLSLKNIALPQETSMDIFIDHGKVSYLRSNDRLKVVVNS